MDVSVADYGAVGDASTDDHAAIQAAIDAAGSGAVVLPDGHYMVSRSLYLRKGTKLVGHHAPCWLPDGARRPVIQARGDFVGDGIICVHSNTVTGHSVPPVGGLIQGLCVSGNNVGTTVQGAYWMGNAGDWTVRDVEVLECTGSGFRLSGHNTENLHDVNLWHCMASACDNSGFLLTGRSYDHRLVGCVAHNCLGAGGFTIENSQPSSIEFVSCRSEWNAGHGYTLASGDKNTFLGCITDRNGQNGFYFNTGAEEGPATMTGCYTNRDGHSQDSYAGVRIHNSYAVITGLAQRFGRDDAGQGRKSPKYGVSLTGTSVVLIGGQLAGVTNAWHAEPTVQVGSQGRILFNTNGAIAFAAV